MKIKEIVIDGFKSYGKRRILQNFDQEFNAITGLNGTGKSNILDGICFCLGLTSYRVVRATTMQDLIYKSGHAGVNQATVTIIFDNSVKSKSPEIYKHLDTISITRKIVKKASCKSFYYINGGSSTSTQVKSMFKSIGLNIENPETFFVGQGKITKIVGFKPEDIVDMICEAAGIAYYNEISRKTLNQIEKSSKIQQENVRRIDVTLGRKIVQFEREKALKDEFTNLKDNRVNKIEILNEEMVKYCSNILKSQESIVTQLHSQKQELEAREYELNNERKVRISETQFNENDDDDNNPKKTINLLKVEIEESTNELNSEKDKIKAIESKSQYINRELKEEKDKFTEYEEVKEVLEEQDLRVETKLKNIVKQTKDIKNTIQSTKNEAEDLKLKLQLQNSSHQDSLTFKHSTDQDIKKKEAEIVSLRFTIKTKTKIKNRNDERIKKFTQSGKTREEDIKASKVKLQSLEKEITKINTYVSYIISFNSLGK